MKSKTLAMAIPGPLPQTPAAQSFFSFHQPELEAPIIDKSEPFPNVVQKITKYANRLLPTQSHLISSQLRLKSYRLEL